jgi:queuine/archaeosine tRNA-ribosyltransferase
MQDIRHAIRRGNLEQFTREFLQNYMPEEERPSREE